MSPQIATNTAVSRDELLDFIRPRHHAIVITARADAPGQVAAARHAGALGPGGDWRIPRQVRVTN